jgi:hypothetical protein
VVQATRSCGPRDTAADPGHRKGNGWRGIQRALVVALVLHLPFVPTPLAVWMGFPFAFGDFSYDDTDAEAIIPVDLDLTTDNRPEPSAAEPPSPVAAPRPETAPALSSPKGVDRDRDLDAGRHELADGGHHDKRNASTASAVDAGPNVVDAGPPALSDPMAAAGGAGKIAAKEPNLQVYLATNVLRKHPIGAALSRVLMLIPAWHAYFEGSSIDPVRDFNHILITGPHFVGDLSKIVAVMDLNVGAEAVTEAIDGIVHRNHGVWLDDPTITAARVEVDGVKRVFALLPERRLLVVLPEEAKDQLVRLKSARGFKSSAEGLVVSILHPQAAFRPLFPLPATIRSVRLAVVPTADGGADVAMEATDATARDAANDAPILTRELEQRRRVDLVLTSVEVCSATTFVAVDDKVRGQVHVANDKVKLIMSMAEHWADELSERRREAAELPTPRL